MKILDTIGGIWRGLKGALSTTSTVGWENTRFFPRPGRGAVSPEAASRLSTYFACVRVIAEDVGKLPLFVYERLEPRGRRKAIEHPVFRLLHRSPNPANTHMTAFETLTQWAVSWGNGFFEIARNAFNDPAALWPIHPSRVTVVRADSGGLDYFIRNDDRTEITIEGPNMIHIRGIGDDMVGWSPSALAASTLNIGLSQEEFVEQFLNRGASLSGVLEHPATLGEQAAANLRESWGVVYGGAENAGKVAVLEEGMKFNAISMRLTDAQFLQSRKFTIEEIARWFRVPPHKIGHLERATFSNIEEQNIDYVTDTLLSWLTRIEEELDRKLLDDGTKFFAEHSLNALLRGNSTARGNFYKTMVGIGTFTQNDVLEKENMNPFEGGDKHWVPVNWTPIEGGTLTLPAGRNSNGTASKEEIDAQIDAATVPSEG